MPLTYLLFLRIHPQMQKHFYYLLDVPYFDIFQLSIMSFTSYTFNCFFNDLNVSDYSLCYF